MKRQNLITVVLLFLAISLQAKTIKVLAIGNSFSVDAVEQYLYELCAESGDQLIIGNAYRGGQGLESHWNVVTKNEPAFSYRKIVKGHKTTKENCLLSTIIRDEKWDMITFQQVSQDAGIYNTYEPYLTNLITYAKSYAKKKKVKIGFHMTWAYPQYSTHFGFKPYDNNQQKMYQSIVSSVEKALTMHPDIKFVIPSGTAIQNARTYYFGDHLNRDGFHLDLGIGRYIAACTWSEVITGKSCIGKNFHPENVSEKDALAAQHAAHAAVLAPYRVTN